MSGGAPIGTQSESSATGGSRSRPVPGAAQVDLSGMAELKAIFRIRAFRRLWIVLGFSSIGDWLGILATGSFSSSLFANPTAKGVAFGGTIAVRLIPALVLGPIAGVFADRFDRRRTMVVCDTIRFLLYLSIPLVSVVASSVVTLTWIGIATFLIETAQMLWAPAKEAAVPNLVPKARLERANQLGMAITYGVAPVLAGVVLAGLNWLIGHLGFGTSYSAALVLDAITYLATALMVWFGIKEISGRRESGPTERKPSMLRQFADGWRYVARFPMARGLVLGILGAFAAGGVVIGTGQFYAQSLGGGPAAFYLLFALLFVGIGFGVVVGPKLVGALSRRRWFGLSIIMAAGAVALLGIAPHLFVAAIFTIFVGCGAGMAFLNGITLLGAEIDDKMRGRVYSFIQVSVQGVLLLALFLSSVLVGLGSSHRFSVGPVHVSISATRLLLLVAGVLGVIAGYAALRQMDDKPGVPLLADVWSSIRGRPLGLAEPHTGHGVFVVFEGGEGAGKSTQAIKLAAWLRVRGVETVVTREPGATDVGARIRGLVLDRAAAPAGAIAPRAEALLYAADRAHHVATVVRPALDRDAVVVSDRYIDSSLAYQGAGRTLPSEEVGWLSHWATAGLKPDLVVLLDVNPRVGLERATRAQQADRLEAESIEFHDRVRYAFLDLAAADPKRYLVLDASEDQEHLAEKIRDRVLTLLPSPEPETPASASGSAPARPPRPPTRYAAGRSVPTPRTEPDPPAPDATETTELPAVGDTTASGDGTTTPPRTDNADPSPAGTANPPGAADGETTLMPRIKDDDAPPVAETTKLPRVTDDGTPPDGKAAKPSPAETTELPRVDGADPAPGETAKLPRVTDAGAAETAEIPRTEDGTETAELPQVSGDPPAGLDRTALFPTVSEHDVAEHFGDDETVVMPTVSGTSRPRRWPRRKQR